MAKSFNLSHIAIFLTLPIFLSGCSVFWGNNKQFNNPVIGAFEIAQNILGDKKETKACVSKNKKANVACQKQVDALEKSIENPKTAKNNGRN